MKTLLASVLVAPVFAAKLVRYTAPKTTTASHTKAWDIESDFCVAKGARLPTFKEICPNGAGGDSAPALGCESTHSWMPYDGQHGKNSWVYVGCGGHGGIVCKDHVKHHGNPGWGSGDVYGDKVDCMHSVDHTGCLDWTCAQWCEHYDEKYDSVYAASGCEDDGDDECKC